MSHFNASQHVVVVDVTVVNTLCEYIRDSSEIKTAVELENTIIRYQATSIIIMSAQQPTASIECSSSKSHPSNRP